MLPPGIAVCHRVLPDAPSLPRLLRQGGDFDLVPTFVRSGATVNIPRPVPAKSAVTRTGPPRVEKLPYIHRDPVPTSSKTREKWGTSAGSRGTLTRGEESVIVYADTHAQPNQMSRIYLGRHVYG